MKKKKPLKINITADITNGHVDLRFTPKLKTAEFDKEKQLYITTLLAGSQLGLTVLLDQLPLLRPATEEEVELKTYIFKDEEADNKLYKARLALYTSLGETFAQTLSELFPDIEYIENTLKHHQEEAMNNTREEHAKVLVKLRKLAKKIREEKKDEGPKG